MNFILMSNLRIISKQTSSWLLCIFIGALFQFSSDILTFLLVRMPLHEIGHALIANLGGRFAIPVIVAGITFGAQDRSQIYSILLLLASLFCLYQSYKLRNIFLLCTSLFISLSIIQFSFIMSATKHEEFIIKAGLAGEIYFSALCIMLYFVKLPSFFYWDFFKYPFTVYGSMGFTNVMLYWNKIKNNQAQLPFGSLLSSDGANETSGDLNRLMQMGWTELQIRTYYYNCVKKSLFIIALVFIISLYLKLSQKSSHASESEIADEAT